MLAARLSLRRGRATLSGSPGPGLITSRVIMRTPRIAVSLLLAAFLGLPATMNAADTPQELLVYIGTYTNAGKSQGIYCFRLDLASGTLTENGVTAGVKNPSFLAIHPSGKYLYSVSEVSDAGGKPTG